MATPDTKAAPAKRAPKKKPYKAGLYRVIRTFSSRAGSFKVGTTGIHFSAEQATDFANAGFIQPMNA